VGPSGELGRLPSPKQRSRSLAVALALQREQNGTGPPCGCHVDRLGLRAYCLEVHRSMLHPFGPSMGTRGGPQDQEGRNLNRRTESAAARLEVRQSNSGAKLELGYGLRCSPGVPARSARPNGTASLQAAYQARGRRRAPLSACP
jgi:hypothetical protein